MEPRRRTLLHQRRPPKHLHAVQTKVSDRGVQIADIEAQMVTADIAILGTCLLLADFLVLIPGLGVRHFLIILAGPTVLSAVRACPPHDGVRRRWWINVESAVALRTLAKNRTISPPPSSRQGRLFPPSCGTPVISLCVLHGNSFVDQLNSVPSASDVTAPASNAATTAQRVRAPRCSSFEPQPA